MGLRKVLFTSALLLCFSAPVTGWAADMYQITGTELTQLENIFSQLKTEQQEQEKQIEMLKSQLTKSETAIKQSESSLQKANKSLQESVDEAKREHDRLKRQRDTWAILAGLALGIAIVHEG